MRQQWENLSSSQVSPPSYQQVLPTESPVYKELEIFVHIDEIVAKKKKRKFGNLRISTNILVRGGEEDGYGSQPTRRLPMLTSWYSCPWVVSFRDTRMCLFGQQHTAAVMACHFHNEVIKNTVLFILESPFPQLSHSRGSYCHVDKTLRQPMERAIGWETEDPAAVNKELRPANKASGLGSGSSSPSSLQTTAASWQTLSLNYPANPLPDSWLSEAVGDNIQATNFWNNWYAAVNNTVHKFTSSSKSYLYKS